MENILESLHTADKLRALREADQQQQAQPAQPQAQQPQTAGNVDQAQLEKAFEAALQTVKSDIVKEVQGLMEKFGAELVKKIQGNGGNENKNETATSQPQQSNQQPAQEENTNGNK